MIPSIIHQVWVGPNKMPDDYLQWVEEIKALHPHFTHILWTDENVSELNIEGFEYLRNYSEYSDLIRWHLMVHMGGVYIDADFELFKSIDAFCYHKGFFGLFHDKKGLTYPLSGLMGFEKGHPMAVECLDLFMNNCRRRRDGTEMDSGQLSNLLPQIWEEVATRPFPRPEIFNGVIMLPPEIFYGDGKSIHAYAHHHGGGAWFPGGIGYAEP